MTRASIIVVAHVGMSHLEDSIASLDGVTAGGRHEVVLVDNASADVCAKGASKRWPWLKVVRSDTNLGFAGGVNLGADAASGEVLILLNDDAAAEPGFVEAHLDTLAIRSGVPAKTNEWALAPRRRGHRRTPRQLEWEPTRFRPRRRHL